MTAVLRIALSFFSIVPLQRWMNWIGVGLFAFALLNLGRDGVLILTMLGTVHLTIVPAFCGGVALRSACTPSLLHVRPHGRIRLLLGATLAITLVAAMAALAFQIDVWSRAMGASHRPPVPSPAFAFQLAWCATALTWIGMFVVSRSQLAYALFGIFPLLIFWVGRIVATRSGTASWMLALGVLLWIGFAVWLMQAQRIRRPAVNSSGASTDTTPFGWITDALPLLPQENSPRHATFLHLLGGRLSLFVVNGLWIALIPLAAHLFMDGTGNQQRRSSLHSMLPLLCMMSVPMGFTIARRARSLWLRAGADRAGLFRTAESLGLRATMLSWSIAAAAVVLTVAMRGVHSLPTILTLHVIPLAVVAAGFFYGGLAMVRGFSVRDVVLGVVLGLFFLLQVILIQSPEPSSTRSAAVLGIGLAMIAVLRTYAAWSWRRLDWRIAKMPPPAPRIA